METVSNTECDRTQRLVAMGQMAASLAHEIRNPLGSMELFCTLLMKDLQQRPESLSLAQQIHAGIKSLDRIIANCLQFARDVSPRRALISNPARYLREILDKHEPQAHASNVSLNLVNEGEAIVSVDGYLLEQALSNLLVNAIQASTSPATAETPGTVIVTSRISADEQWTISIADDGEGMTPAVLARIFDPFFTTKTKGTGLGLAIVYSIVKAHQGTIDVQSKPDHGSVFTICLPIAGIFKEHS